MQDNLESFAYATYLKITIPFVASSPKSYVICILKIKHVWMSIVGHRSGTWKIMTIINECFWIKNEKNLKNLKISNVFEAIPDAFVSHQANLEKTNEMGFFFFIIIISYFSYTFSNF